jgi:hypothetical protein
MDIQATGKVFSPQRRTSSISKHQISSLFSILVGHFCSPRPDSADQNQCGSATLVTKMTISQKTERSLTSLDTFSSRDSSCICGREGCCNSRNLRHIFSNSSLMADCPEAFFSYATAVLLRERRAEEQWPAFWVFPAVAWVLLQQHKPAADDLEDQEAFLVFPVASWPVLHPLFPCLCLMPH